MKALLCLCLFLCTGLLLADAKDDEINALISIVENSKGMIFIRNGSEHTASEAASHLRLKWRNQADQVKTAEDFIIRCGTQSSITGEKYRIKSADGKEMLCKTFLEEQLKTIRSKQGVKSR